MGWRGVYNTGFSFFFVTILKCFFYCHLTLKNIKYVFYFRILEFAHENNLDVNTGDIDFPLSPEGRSSE